LSPRRTTNGEGGTVAVVSSTDANFAGTILAEGGLNGGRAEFTDPTVQRVVATKTVTVTVGSGLTGHWEYTATTQAVDMVWVSR
jgi:hypothetical protein